MSMHRQKGLSINQAYGRAVAFQRSGDSQAAKRLFGAILQSGQEHAPSLQSLAGIAYLEGDDEVARAYIDRAILSLEHSSDSDALETEVLNSVRTMLANLLLARDRIEDATSCLLLIERGVPASRPTVAEFRKRRGASIAAGRDSVFVASMPKAASESIWNKTADVLGMPQGNVALGLFPDSHLVPSRMDDMARGGIVTKEHILPNRFNVEQLLGSGINRIICNVRDPRQATLSYAHFSWHNIRIQPMAPLWRKIMPPESVLSEGFDSHLDWCIVNFLPKLIAFSESWRQVSLSAEIPIDVLFLSFEAFKDDNVGYFSDIIEFLGLKDGSREFKNRSEIVHLRKGLKDEWTEVFSIDQRERASAMIPIALASFFDWRVQ